MDKSLSVENQILLACASGDFDAEAQAGILALLGQGIDWEALLASAQEHHVLPLLYSRLRALAGVSSGLDRSRIPLPVMARLKSAYYTSLLRGRRLETELVEVLVALRREGVEAIVLKGAALSRTVYSDPVQRPMSDLDLLIRPEDAGRASAVLTSLGFGLSPSIPGRLVPFQQRFGGGLEWVRFAAGQITYLDVHYNLVGPYWCWTAFPVEPDALWVAARALILDQVPAWQLSIEDTLVHLSLHLALHHGYACPLISYVDIDRAIAAVDGAPFWPRLVERAGQFQLKVMVYYSLECAHRLLRTPVPPDVLAALRPGRLQLHFLRWLSSLDTEAVLREPNEPLHGMRQLLLYAALSDHIGVLGRLVRSLVFPDNEWLAARYFLQSRRRAWLYRPVHILRLARSFLRGFHRPLIESGLD